MPHQNPDGTPVQPEPPAEPAPEQNPDELTDREDFDHPNPEDSPKRDKPAGETLPPPPAPEPPPARPYYGASLGGQNLRFLDISFKELPYHHLFTNTGKLRTSGVWVERYRNTCWAMLSALAVGVAVWNSPDVYENDQVAYQALARGVEGWGRSDYVHDFYHKHDVAVWSSYWNKTGLLTARADWEPVIPGMHQTAPYITALGGAPKWDGKERPLKVQFDRDADWRDVVKELRNSDVPFTPYIERHDPHYS